MANPIILCTVPGCQNPTKRHRYCSTHRGRLKRNGHLGTRSLQERFWRHVDRETTPDGCWPWRGCAHDDYGRFWINGAGEKAHRVAWELSSGPIPDGLNTLHSCDNPPCCRPAHLFLGTQQANVVDMITKGRNNHPKGERNINAALTAEDVREIRALRAAGMSYSKIAEKFGVVFSTIASICTGRTWTHVT